MDICRMRDVDVENLSGRLCGKALCLGREEGSIEPLKRESSRDFHMQISMTHSINEPLVASSLNLGFRTHTAQA